MLTTRPTLRVLAVATMLGVGVSLLGAYGVANADPAGGAHHRPEHGHPQSEDGDDAGPCDPGLSWQDEEGCDPANDLPGSETDDFSERVEHYAGERYAGQWIDRADSRRPVLVVGFVDRTPRDQAFLDSLTGQDRRVRAAKQLFSTEELEAVTGAVVSQPVQSMLGSDDRTNRVTLFVRPPDLENARKAALRELRASRDPLVISAFAKLHGSATSRLFRVEAWPGFKNAESRTTYPKHKGGRSLTVDLDNGLSEQCTSAFTVETNASAAPAGLTAGHCARGYLIGGVWVGAHYLARPGKNPYRESTVNDADAMRYGLPSSSDMSDDIFVNGTRRLNRDLQAPRHTVRSLKTAVKVCFQGTTSDNNNCGAIRFRDQNVKDDEGHVVRHVYVMDYPCQGGDSGGPVYSIRSNGSAKAAGVVKGSIGASWCGFSQIGYALAATDTHLYYE